MMKTNPSIDTVWMEENTRFLEEHDSYVKNFGSLPRLGLVANSMVNKTNVITPQSLKSMVKVMGELLAFNNEDSLTMKAEINGEQYKMKADDFCERPIVPEMFKPTDPTDRLSYIRRDAFQSYGYVQLIKCLRRELPSLKYENNPTFGMKLLPDGWGIDMFPCMRVSIIDCFKEGQVDYPKNMKILQESVKGVGLVMLNLLGKQSNVDAAQTCLNEYENQTKTDLETLNRPNAAYIAAQNRYFLELWTPKIFLSWGYHWRVSMNRFKTPEALMAYIQEALEAPQKVEGYGIEKCLKDGLMFNGYPKCCMTWNGMNVGTEMFIGKVMKENSTSDKWVGLSSVRHPIINQPFDSPFWRAEMKKKYDVQDPIKLQSLITDWEGQLIDHIGKYHHKVPESGFETGGEYDGIKVDLHTDRSTGDMSEESAALEPHLVIIGVGMLFLYSVIVMGSFSNRCINSNILTMSMGFVVSGIAVAGGMGLMSALGFEQMVLSTLVALVGFIISIGNIYILMFIFSSHFDPERTVRENMTTTVEIGGHAVFVISATIISGFLCGVYVPIPGLRSLSVQVACTVLFSFLLQMFLFVPIMVWNCRRAQDNRMDCLPIKRQSGKPPKNSFLSETKDLFKDYPTIKHSSAKKSLLSTFARHLYGPVILHKVARIIIITISVIEIAFAVFATLQMTKDGLMMSDVAKPGSYQHSFATLNEAEYEMFSSYVVTESTNYPKHQNKNMKIYDSLASNYWTVKYPEPRIWDWLSNGTTTLTGFHQMKQDLDNNITSAIYKKKRADAATLVDDPLFEPDNSQTMGLNFLPKVDVNNPIPPSMFNSIFTQWMNHLGAISGPSLSCHNDKGVKSDCKESTSRLVATRTAIYARNLTTHDNIIASIKSLRNAVDEISDGSGGNFKAFVYGFTFSFWGMYINLRRNIALICGCILVGVVLPITVFHCSLNAAFLIALCVIAGVFEIFGSFWILGINLNGFSLVPLVLSIALIVQWSVFVIHNFIGFADGKKKRAKDTISQTFPGVFSGVFSLFVLILPLAFTASPFMRSYVALLFLSICFVTFTVPMLMLPCILSLMGPRNFDINGCDEGEDSLSDDDGITPAYPKVANDEFEPPHHYTKITLVSHAPESSSSPIGMEMRKQQPNGPNGPNGAVEL